MTTVLCIVAGTKDDPKPISARACVEAQRDGRCFCLKGVPALQAVGPELEPAEGDGDRALSKKRKLREDLGVLKARCQGFLRKPPSQQYAGPAIAAAAGNPVAQPLSSSVPLPAPPKQDGSSFLSKKEEAPRVTPVLQPEVPELDEREDEHEAAISAQEMDRRSKPFLTRASPKKLCIGGCGSLFSSIKFDKCWRCRVGLKKHHASAPDVDEVAAAVDATRAAKKTIQQPAPPAKEKPVAPKLTDRECEWKEEKCTTKLGLHNKSGLCARHASVMRLRVLRAKAEKKPRKTKAARALRSVTNPEATAPAEAPKSFTGMPSFDQVPIGWAVGFLKFLRDQSVAVDGIGATGT